MNSSLASYQLRWTIKVWKLNFALIPFYITISLTAHIIAMRLSVAFGFPIISAAWIYMAVFVINDIVRSYSPNRNLVFIFILLEALCNFLSFSYCNIIAHSNAPDYLAGTDAYKTVFGAVWHLYISNLVGSAIAAVIDVWFFSVLFFRKNMPFFFASLISSVSTLFVYTVITDYYGLHGIFPQHVWEITWVNVVTNILMLTFYSFIGQIMTSWIHNKYLESI